MAFVWELTNETKDLPLGCLQGGHASPLTPQQAGALGPDASALTTPETTQGQMHGFFSQLPFTCYLPEVASAGD